MQESPLVITYVTDPDLDEAGQRRVVREVVACAQVARLRIAFRLPDSTDEEVRVLIDWYSGLANADQLLPPLTHNRPAVTEAIPGGEAWLPSRCLRDEQAHADAFSVHSQDEARIAIARGASELIYGHVFASDSHPGESPRGMATLAAIAANMPNVTAIGGINEQTIGALGAIGIRRIAVIRAISRSPDIPSTLRRMEESWHAAYNEGRYEHG
ncbi:MAG: thiamine phosphate synthase [Thermomicrobiales bacterium]|nr:thiamine phosphate synthase [Thermomicrobiales bacterium]